MWTFAWQTCEIGKPVQSEVHFTGGASNPEIFNGLDEIGREVAGSHKVKECLFWIESRNHHVCLKLVAVFQGNAHSTTILNHDLTHRRFCHDLCTEVFG